VVAVKPALTLRRKTTLIGGPSFYAVDTPGESGLSFGHEDIKQALREREVVFSRMDQEEQDKLFLALIWHTETGFTVGKGVDKRKAGDVNMLTRIIRNGGLIEYVKKLESNK
jgi:hypothetical protein